MLRLWCALIAAVVRALLRDGRQRARPPRRQR